MMTHIGGYPDKYNKSIIGLIKERKPDILICGHSHILRVEYDKKNKLPVQENITNCQTDTKILHVCSFQCMQQCTTHHQNW